MEEAPKEEESESPLFDRIDDRPLPEAYSNLIKGLYEGHKASGRVFIDHLQKVLLPFLKETRDISEGVASKTISQANKYVDERLQEAKKYVASIISQREETVRAQITSTASAMNETIMQYFTKTLSPELKKENDEKLARALGEYQEQEAGEHAKIKREFEAVLSKLKTLEENGASKNQLQSAVDELRQYDQKLSGLEMAYNAHKESIADKLNEIGKAVSQAVEDRLSATASDIEKKLADAGERYAQVQKHTEERLESLDTALKRTMGEANEQLKKLRAEQTTLEGRVNTNASAEEVAKLTRDYNDFKETYARVLEGVTRLQNTREELVSLVKKRNVELIDSVENAKSKLNDSVRVAVTEYASRLILDRFKELAPDLLPQLKVAMAMYVDDYLKKELPILVQQIQSESKTKAKEPEQPFFGVSPPKRETGKTRDKLSDLLRER